MRSRTEVALAAVLGGHTARLPRLIERWTDRELELAPPVLAPWVEAERARRAEGV